MHVPGIEPALHESLLHEPGELALTEHGMDKIHLAKGMHVHRAKVQSVLNPVILLVSTIIIT